MVKVAFLSQCLCQAGAFLGCERHPVEAEIRFLDGRIEPITRLPLTRWQRSTERDALIVAAVFALLFAVLVELFARFFAISTVIWRLVLT